MAGLDEGIILGELLIGDWEGITLGLLELGVADGTAVGEREGV